MRIARASTTCCLGRESNAQAEENNTAILRKPPRDDKTTRRGLWPPAYATRPRRPSNNV
jgi:hypothetical protein